MFGCAFILSTLDCDETHAATYMKVFNALQDDEHQMGVIIDMVLTHMNA